MRRLALCPWVYRRLAPSVALRRWTYAERLEKLETLKARAERVYVVSGEARFKESWDVYPFNSGYFMCVAVKGAEAEAVRLRLLDEHGIGVIAIGSTDIRVAFSCLEVDQVEPLFEALHAVVQDCQRAD